ncbi:DUF481 domain-containing protein [Acinetobacter wuhouensis]|uniref:DUF481 domain-containing protein n=1 Tax=Acinetobacter wuhouensis TaxID=1879050 RepID=A0A385C592_9GAMM|nr:DUF481 domain-containing protein [Acinetobacter wuhouensis]AXQ22881.1 DUF481 domain-containing protein [Acinetobacter wuhouensis]RZG49302.1 DUF481 domain-containing protein [Acinetobacter wuhouensis]RZG75210.1 DUF481 domain-containing protein [Acinetobacter wuhouensis]
MKRLIIAILATYTTCSYADLGPTRTDAGKVDIKENKPYRLEGDLSYLLNSTKSNGNSNTKENLAANVLFQRQVGVWGQELRAEAVSANDDGSSGSNVERYMLAGKVLHRSTDTIYQFAKLQGDKDLSSNFDYQVSLTGGVGFDLLKDEKQTLTAEAGAGYRYSKERYEPYDDFNEVIGTVAAYYEYKFNDKVKFNQDLSYEFGEKSQILRSRSSVGANLTDTVSGLVSYQIKDTQADVGNSRDSLLSVGLKYIY